MNKEKTQIKIDKILHNAQVRWNTAKLKADNLQGELDNYTPIILVKLGRVLRFKDLTIGDSYFVLPTQRIFKGDNLDRMCIQRGEAFYDAASRDLYREYLNLNHQLLCTQMRYGGMPKLKGSIDYVITVNSCGEVISIDTRHLFHKVRFKSPVVRDQFKLKYTEEQLLLLITGGNHEELCVSTEEN